MPTKGGALTLSEESEYLQLVEIQRTAIKLLEKLLKDYKQLYASERDQARQLRDILERIECPGFELAEERSERELITVYGIV